MAKFKNPEQTEYIAGENYDYHYTAKELRLLKQLHKNQTPLYDIAKALNKRPIEVFICIASLIDQNELPKTRVTKEFYS